MLRLIVVSILCSVVTLGSAPPAAAFDYEAPFVPPQFLLNAPPADAPSPSGDARLLAQGTRGAAAAAAVLGVPSPGSDPLDAGSAGLSWTHDGAPGPLRFVPNGQWTDGGGGCALWNWTSC